MPRLACRLFLGSVALLIALALAAATRPALGRPDEQTISVDGVTRSFILHRPATLTGPAPLVLVFHGGGGRPDYIAHVTGMDEVADREGFIVVYPAGAERGARGGGTWNVGGPFSASSADDMAFVQTLVSELERTQQIDRSRVYAAGFSMGGVFTYRLACEMSDTFAAIAVASSSMVDTSCQPTSPVAVLHMHGTDDDRIPLNGGRGAMTTLADRMWPPPKKGVEAWSRFDGCAAQPTRTDDQQADNQQADDQCSSYGGCRASVEFCVVPGLGHAWPTGGAERAWAFFAANPKRAR